MDHGYTMDEQDEFLDKIDDVQKKIQDIIEGKIDMEELDRQEMEEKERERLKEVAKQIKQRE